jgi:phosphomevalonate kinase
MKLLDIAQERECIHRIAQAAHCVAQGKIGSGFDVYTACHGTCAYTRFAASRIEPLMAEKSKVVVVEGRSNTVSVTLSTLKAVMGNFKHPESSKDAWIPSGENIPTCNGLPRNFKLLLADIHAGGTETPGMVSKIFAWKNSLNAADSSNLWNRLARANITAIEELQKLTKIQKSNNNGSEYNEAVKTIIASSLCGNDEEGWAAASKKSAALAQFDSVRKAFAECRKLLREVGENAGVEVEPPKLTPLLDSTLSTCPGVIAVGCPGAGGYDAVFALAVEQEGSENNNNKNNDDERKQNGPVCDAIEKFWQSYHADGLHVCPLLVRESGRGLIY